MMMTPRTKGRDSTTAGRQPEDGYMTPEDEPPEEHGAGYMWPERSPGDGGAGADEPREVAGAAVAGRPPVRGRRRPRPA